MRKIWDRKFFHIKKYACKNQKSKSRVRLPLKRPIQNAPFLSGTRTNFSPSNVFIKRIHHKGTLSRDFLTFEEGVFMYFVLNDCILLEICTALVLKQIFPRVQGCLN
jgi:hypothetical protein